MKYFISAALFGGFLLVRAGVPPLPIILGCLLAGGVMWARKGRPLFASKKMR
jgi:hypothetical protein